MREIFAFLKAALRRPMEVSTVFPTSKYLAEALLKRVDFTSARPIAELGPGTGAITRYLSPKLPQPAQYIGIEINDQMYDFLREEFPHLHFERGAAEQLSQLVPPGSIGGVISSLPWTIFPDEMQDNTLRSIHTALGPDGVFVTYMCINAIVYPNATRFLKRLNETFSKVERSKLQWLNLPPAYIYRATK